MRFCRLLAAFDLQLQGYSLAICIALFKTSDGDCMWTQLFLIHIAVALALVRTMLIYIRTYAGFITRRLAVLQLAECTCMDVTILFISRG